MRVLMIAPPGAGKGTQGALIAAHFDIPHIATGELLRDHVARRTALGQAVQAYLDRGELVPDQVVLDMVREAVVAAKAAGGGYVLDGIPRNMPQARAIYLIARELGMTADVALHLQAGDAELMRRLLARAALEHRSDDTPEIIAQRLALYYEVTSPIISWYRDRGILVSVDAMRSAQQVGREILAALEAMRPFLDQVPALARRSVDLTGLGDAFGATGPAAGTGLPTSRRRIPVGSAIAVMARCPGAALRGQCPPGPSRRAWRRYARYKSARYAGTRTCPGRFPTSNRPCPPGQRSSARSA
jgi:adenylate kinase